MRGNKSGAPPDWRKNASRKERSARRVGSKTVLSASSAAPPLLRASRPAARASTKGWPAGMVNTFGPGCVSLMA